LNNFKRGGKVVRADPIKIDHMYGIITHVYSGGKMCDVTWFSLSDNKPIDYTYYAPLYLLEDYTKHHRRKFLTELLTNI